MYINTTGTEIQNPAIGPTMEKQIAAGEELVVYEQRLQSQL
jgi:hypothetical protein